MSKISPCDRLQSFIDNTQMKVTCYGEITDTMVDRIITRIEGGEKLPTTFHFMEGCVAIYPPGKTRGGASVS